MPPLERENDTYVGFFSGDDLRGFCNSKAELEMYRNLAESIPGVITEEIRSMCLSGQLSRSDVPEDFDVIPLVASTLSRIVSDFKKCRVARSKFMKMFPGIKKKRVEGIRLLREIASKINRDRFNCNVSKEVGAVTGIIGGGLLVAGTALAFVTGPAAAPLIVAGGSMFGLGGATSFGTTIAETNRLRRDINKAKKLIDEDRENFKALSSWLEQSREVTDVLQKIIDIDLLKRTVNDFQELLMTTVSLKKRCNELIFRIRAFVNTYLLAIGEFSDSGFWITTLSLIVGFVFALVFMNKKRFLFNTGVAILKLGLGIARLLDIGVDACATGAAFFRAGGAVLTKSVARVAVHGTLASVGIALDIASIVLTSIDIHKGSISATATEISEAADRLEEQLLLLQTLYDEFASSS